MYVKLKYSTNRRPTILNNLVIDRETIFPDDMSLLELVEKIINYLLPDESSWLEKLPWLNFNYISCLLREK